LFNGLKRFSEEFSIPLDITFTDHRHTSIERTVEYINKINPDVCLILYLNELDTFVDHINCPIKCGWIFDVTYGGKEIPQSTLASSIEKLNFFFSITPDHAKQLKNGYWVPEGCDPYSHFPIKSLTQYDVTFVGQVTENSDFFKQRGFVHLDRQDWLLRIGETFKDKLKIFGNMVGVTHLDKYHSSKYLHSSWDNNVVSTNSVINLGHSGWPNVKYSWSARDYRIMAARGFLLTNRIKGHTDFFKDEYNIALYSSDEECIDKIRFYMANETLRLKIAQRGMERALGHFTFKHSFETIFAHLELL
jgi:hypothetical protein